MNITTVQGFETFTSSLTNKSFCPSKEGSGVDLVLSCVDNYEARMAVNQVAVTSFSKKAFLLQIPHCSYFTIEHFDLTFYIMQLVTPFMNENDRKLF